MKVSLNLLKEFADLNQPADTILEIISSRIGEVENVEELASKYQGIVVGKIIDSRPHPSADKLSLNLVDIGRRQVQVVAGDKSLEPGQRVAYIPPGNIVPATAGKTQLKLDIRKIRGQDSHGMLASEYELDFSAAHEGVLKLDTDAKPGTGLNQLYKLDDHIIDVETKVLTHRPDMFGHLGFARELSAALGRPFTSPAWYLNRHPKWPQPSAKLGLELDNQLPELVPRITLAAFEGTIVQSSPTQIQSWLMRLGIRPLNNLVDLTNYMMVVTGQPLHAFDYDKVAGGQTTAKIIVRQPKKGEKLKLIDGSTIEPHKDAILIANHAGPIGLGGIMGGQATEVDERTKRIIVEAANFNMYSIRNVSMAHGIASEAVTRFARGQDPDAIAAVQRKAAELLKEWSGANPAGRLVDDYPRPRKSRTVKISAVRVNALLGVDETASSMARTLNNAELTAKVSGGKIEVSIPTWRPDLNIEADMAEEVGRLKGYSRIKVRIPRRGLQPAGSPPLRQLEEKTRRLLSAGGAAEILSYSGVPQTLLDNCGQDSKRAYRIRNALSPDVELMRLSLIPSLLEKVYPNLRRGHERFALFETGAAHNNHLIENKLPQEQPSIGLIVTDSKASLKKSGAAYFKAQAYLGYFLGGLGYDFILSASSPAADPWLAQAGAPFAAGRRSFVNVGTQTIGVLGEFAPEAERALRLPPATAGFELHLDRLLASAKTADNYRPLSKYPPVVVDVTLRTPSELPYAKLESALRSAMTKDVEQTIRPLDIFSPDKSYKHTSFRLEFTSRQRTLTQKEVNRWLESAVNKVAKRTGAVQV